jgi:hypothetical protein
MTIGNKAEFVDGDVPHSVIGDLKQKGVRNCLVVANNRPDENSNLVSNKDSRENGGYNRTEYGGYNGFHGCKVYLIFRDPH